MPGYEDLEDTIGKMKRAAIDCWMADSGFYPNWGNDMIYAKWGFMLNFYNRPDENGVGGGDGNGVKDSVEAEFEQIRSAVDAVVAPWLDLPDGTACATPQTVASTTAAQLGSSTTSPTVQNNGEIGTSGGTIEAALVNNIQGSFTAPFLDKYYTQFSKITHGLGDACVLLEANYAGEAAMWPAARADVAQLCEVARAAWSNKAAKAAQESGQLTLTVIGAVGGAVASIVTAGAGTVAAVATLATIGAATSSAVQAISADVELAGSTYEDILASLSGALTTLNTALDEQEQELQAMLNSGSSAMSSDQANFNLDAFSLGGYPYDDGTINMEQSHASMVSTNMGRIESALSTAHSGLGSAPASSPTSRSSTIGLGSSGTHAAASELHAITARFLELTFAEYVRGHQLFDATVADYFQTDADSRHQINVLVSEEALQSEVGL